MHVYQEVANKCCQSLASSKSFKEYISDSVQLVKTELRPFAKHYSNNGWQITRSKCFVQRFFLHSSGTDAKDGENDRWCIKEKERTGAWTNSYHDSPGQLHEVDFYEWFAVCDHTHPQGWVWSETPGLTGCEIDLACLVWPTGRKFFFWQSSVQDRHLARVEKEASKMHYRAAQMNNWRG